MRAKAFAAILAATAALIVLALPTSAGAAKAYHQPASVSANLQGTGTDGFHFFLFAFDRGVVFSLVKISAEGAETVSYYDLHHKRRPEFDEGRLDLKVGNLGHFRGRFVAHSTKTEKLPEGCTGEPTTIEEGDFVGSFVFHGERGYAGIHAGREKGSVTRIGTADCEFPKGHRRHRRPSRHAKKEREQERERAEGEFRLVAGDAKGRLLIQASREEAPREPNSQPTYFDVTLDGGKAGSFEVSRSAAVFENGPKAASTSFAVPNLAEPTTDTSPFMQPKMFAGGVSAGTNLATGRPFFVITTGSRVDCTPFITLRQRALNCPAGIVFIILPNDHGHYIMTIRNWGTPDLTLTAPENAAFRRLLGGCPAPGREWSHRCGWGQYA